VSDTASDRLFLPAYSEEFIFLAHRVGYATDDWQAGARHLQTDIEQHMKQTKEFFERTFGRL
jgi:glutamate-ammonia-ligase adenylyltransferase